MGDEGIVLTDREREALAGLAESIGDPWLARQLAGEDPPPKPPTLSTRPLSAFGPALYRATAGWVGLLVALAGAVLTVTTFVRSTAVASMGLALMGYGVWRLVAGHLEALTLRWTARQTASAERPGPPRTPPAAA